MTDEPHAAAATRPGRDGARTSDLPVRLVAGPVVLVAAALLAVTAWTGLAVRPAGEDWCVAWRMRDHGALGLTHYFYGEANGRLSNALVNAAVYARGLSGPRLLPAALCVALAVGTFVLLHKVLGLAGRRAPVVVVAAGALGITALLLLGSERRYQVVFWAQGSTTHTLPALITLWAVIHALAAWPRGLMAQYLSVVLGTTVAFGMSTLSEAPAAVSGVIAVAAVLRLLPYARAHRDWFVVVWPGAWLIGLAGGLLLLQTSPGLASRTAAPETGPALLSPAGIGATFADWGRAWADAVGHTPAYLCALALGVLLGAGCRGAKAGRAGRLSGRDVLLPLLVVIVSSLAVIAGLRVGYGANGWRFERAYTGFLLPALLAACFYGFLLGERVRPARARAWVVPSAALLTVVGLASLAPALLEVRDRITTRESAWDRQDAQLRAERAHQVQRVRYSPNPIDSLSEPFKMPFAERDWARGCVQDYYRVEDLLPSSRWLQSSDAALYRRVHPYAS